MTRPSDLKPMERPHLTPIAEPADATILSSDDPYALAAARRNQGDEAGAHDLALAGLRAASAATPAYKPIFTIGSQIAEATVRGLHTVRDLNQVSTAPWVGHALLTGARDYDPKTDPRSANGLVMGRAVVSVMDALARYISKVDLPTRVATRAQFDPPRTTSTGAPFFASGGLPSGVSQRLGAAAAVLVKAGKARFEDWDRRHVGMVPASRAQQSLKRVPYFEWSARGLVATHDSAQIARTRAIWVMPRWANYVCAEHWSEIETRRRAVTKLFPKPNDVALACSLGWLTRELDYGRMDQSFSSALISAAYDSLSEAFPQHRSTLEFERAMHLGPIKTRAWVSRQGPAIGFNSVGGLKSGVLSTSTLGSIIVAAGKCVLHYIAGFTPLGKGLTTLTPPQADALVEWYLRPLAANGGCHELSYGDDALGFFDTAETAAKYSAAADLFRAATPFRLDFGAGNAFLAMHRSPVGASGVTARYIASMIAPERPLEGPDFYTMLSVGITVRRSLPQSNLAQFEAFTRELAASHQPFAKALDAPLPEALPRAALLKLMGDGPYSPIAREALKRYNEQAVKEAAAHAAAFTKGQHLADSVLGAHGSAPFTHHQVNLLGALVADHQADLLLRPS